ncbi:riboflavin synthase [Cutibacterium avidum]|uniref:riboflavin synthase n=1 Tax=Cutibacterium avidum TaxID=33010 RepID=UPI0002CCDEFC|nr:riboflavin synthase [Cutibacterium avidum]ERS25012.1 riboflavin synthase, alpha subunit [Propionibacterium sp. KPL2005]ERS29304.1 riboflavin synthase, alpha subunit [Propionibacterium sp. KPL2000]AGJ77061.1 riboflavin synthase subunit alpha [Cutibacterium avidum 44067]KXA66007.1 riboflavin synthase, alpha subunit [Cutibacterium avidum]MCG7370339.1 riboflavin synthase [Cutibacterium avidum]
MFTGIIEEIGEVVAIDKGQESARLSIRGPVVCSDARLGASIAVNGTCLTVTDLDEVTFGCDVMAETLNRTALGWLAPGSRVNLERPVAVAGRLGGHIVQGHVDGVTELVSRTPGDHWEVFRFSLPTTLARYVVEKGSIAINGTSLTVCEVSSEWFEVSLIPTTLTGTVLGGLEPGEPVNIEVDVIAKYLESLVNKEKSC